MAGEAGCTPRPQPGSGDRAQTGRLRLLTRWPGPTSTWQGPRPSPGPGGPCPTGQVCGDSLCVGGTGWAQRGAGLSPQQPRAGAGPCRDTWPPGPPLGPLPLVSLRTGLRCEALSGATGNGNSLPPPRPRAGSLRPSLHSPGLPGAQATHPSPQSLGLPVGSARPSLTGAVDPQPTLQPSFHLDPRHYSGDEGWGAAGLQVLCPAGQFSPGPRASAFCLPVLRLQRPMHTVGAL